MIKNILFDLDGTITNSYEGIVNAVKFSLDKINFKYDESKLISFIGPPLKDSYMELGFSEIESKERIEDFRDYYFKRGMKVTEPDRESFRSKAMPIAEKYANSIDKELYQKILESKGN